LEKQFGVILEKGVDYENFSNWLQKVILLIYANK